MTHQFIGDPPHFWHFVRAKIKCDLSEVVIHIIVAVQINDQEELPKNTDKDMPQEWDHTWELQKLHCHWSMLQSSTYSASS